MTSSRNFLQQTSKAISTNLLQVLKTDSQTLHGWEVARIALDKEMLHTVLFRRRENLLLVNRAGSDFGLLLGISL